jgi:hypothetical protein
MPDQSDALPEKVITGDAQEELAPPGEQSVGATEFGVTADEARRGEPLDARLAREVHDVDDRSADRGGEPYPEDRDEGFGRLAEVPEDDGRDQDSFAAEVGADRGGYAPEERAMHEER